MKYPFSPDELLSLNRSRKWWHSVRDLMPWSERRRIIAEREGRIFDSYFNPNFSLKGGGVQGWEEALESITADGTQILTSTTETIICPDFNFPAYYMAAGRTLRIWSFGVMSNIVTTPGTLTMWTRWGGVAGVVLTQSAAQGLDTTARTNSLWMTIVNIVCRSAGSSGSAISGGILFGNVLSTTAANLLPALLGSAGAPLANTPITAVTIDTTVAKLLSCTAKFSISNSGNNFTCQQRIIEVLN